MKKEITYKELEKVAKRRGKQENKCKKHRFQSTVKPFGDNVVEPLKTYVGSIPVTVGEPS